MEILDAGDQNEEAPSPRLSGWLRTLSLFELTLGAFALLVGARGVRVYLTTEPMHQWHARRLFQNLIWDLRDVGIGVSLVLGGVLLWKGHKRPQWLAFAAIALLWVVAGTLND